MDVSLDKDVDTADAVKFNFLVWVESPVAHARHVRSASVVLLVTCKFEITLVTNCTSSGLTSDYLQLGPRPCRVSMRALGLCQTRSKNYSQLCPTLVKIL